MSSAMPARMSGLAMRRAFNCRLKSWPTTTANTLLTVETHDGEEVLLPLHDDFVVDYDLRARLLLLDVPDGLIDLND